MNVATRTRDTSTDARMQKRDSPSWCLRWCGSEGFSQPSCSGCGRSKRRSLSTVLGVALAMILILAAGGMIDTIVNVVDRQFNEIAIEDATVIASQTVDPDLVAAVADVDGVERAEPDITLSASVTRNGSTVLTTLQGYDQDTQMHGWTNETENTSVRSFRSMNPWG